MSMPKILKECDTRMCMGKKIINPCELYLETLAASGKRSMRSRLKNALKLVGYNDEPEKFPWEKIRYVHFIKIQSSLLRAGKSINTINTTLAAIKGVMRMVFNMGLLKPEEYIRIESIKRLKGEILPVGRSLSDKEIKKLLAACRNSKDIMNVRDRAAIALMMSTGVRREEIVAINCEDYDMCRGLIAIKQGKGRKGRTLVVATGTKRHLNQWIGVRGGNEGALFTRIISNKSTGQRMSAQAIYNMTIKRSEKAGVKRCTPHDLRRTLVTRLLASGIDINTVRKIVGHADINTTARYDRRGDESTKRIIQNVMAF